MILKRLAEYADRVGVPPPMYSTTPIRRLIDIEADGSIHWISLEGEGKRGQRGKEMLAPNVIRTVAVKPKLLADTAEYALGLAGEKTKPVRTAECHRQFVDLVNLCAAKTRLPEAAAVAAFLKAWDPSRPPDGIPPDLAAGDAVTFRVNGRVVIDLPEVRTFWADYTEGSGAHNIMQCLICGRDAVVMERQPLAIKGIPDGQTSGMQLISANAEAFESHGLRASLTAPTCRKCAEAFGKGLNALLGSRDHVVRVGPLIYAFWTREEDAFNPAAFLTQPDDGQVRELLRAPLTGRSPAVDSEDFYAVALSASGGRAVVRDYLETTIGRVRESVTRWFRLQEMVGLDGREGHYYGIYGLAASLYRDANKDIVADVPRQLLRCALYGVRLPESLLFQAVRRNVAEQAVTRPRAMLIKSILLTQGEIVMNELDPADTDSAYRCGRLLAELEELQRRAIPSAKATIVDRYFGTASSAPASVFGTLLRGAQPHLAKLRKEQEGAFFGFQQRLEEIMSGLNGFPKTLTLKDQALFSLGYYHQKAADRKAIQEAVERKKQAKEENAK